ncbi:MAG: hypothetical protein HOF95_10065, partial [Rhodospirillales bacterium]|nr:hypothetical protein [Rhodospirillales bacterium]
MAVKKTKSPPAFGHALFGRGGPIGTLYAFLTTIGGPLVELLLRKRLKRGREDADRLNERRGIAGL